MPRKSRQFAVLALLLLDVNKPVSSKRLVEAVWNGCPPTTAAEQIQTCVWRLRRSFARIGAQDGLIETTASGYALHLREDWVDTSMFDRHVSEAEIARTNGDNQAAISGFRQALRLFRGPVLAEVNSMIVQAAAATWEKRRLAVLEECIELELASGVAAGLVPELTVLVDENPLRERLRCQLMLALSADDRRAEALAAYREGRGLTVAKLGLEPGPRLQEVQRMILAGSPTSSAAAPLPQPPPVRPPGQLPADVTDFVGRSGYVAEVLGLLNVDVRGGVRICALLGRCGAGKTALAVHIAHQLRSRFPDGQLYADLGGSQRAHATVDDVLRGFLHALGYPDSWIPAARHERAAMYRSVLAERRVLVVLDDVADAAQVQQLLPGGPDAAVLVTSRTSVTELPGVSPVEVGVLPEGEAVELFTRIVGTDRCHAEPVSRNQIIRAAGYLPLSVRSAGARLAARPYLSLARFADRLRDPERRLDELAHGGLDVRDSLAPSVRRLPAEARNLWWRLSLLQGRDFPAWVAAVVGDVAPLLAEKLLDFLVDRRLVDVVGVDPAGMPRYRVDELFGLYARKRAQEELPESARARVLSRTAQCSAVGGTTMTKYLDLYEVYATDDEPAELVDESEDDQ
ncbi:AfsR/SARP family transcriptional regulator [Amycolatopsis cihanbeyliensis]|uniref:AfsR/SARP family transcriptional regulator n=1 Tax=Amycolatopsis cihanbeyliensis TaxID=1128664 RepID=UPI0011510CD8|nr:BTAD domain-containing putative transcriptional regulator [Amycolatopsis cihanbeyliensis]